MNKRIAVVIFVLLSVLIAIILISNTIRPVVGAALFAVTLLIVGGLSEGLRNDNVPPVP